MFYSRTKKPPVQDTPTGDGFENTYKEFVDKDGKITLECVGKTSMYEMIQESLEETQIYNILEKYELGDTSVLNRIAGFYDDITAVPTDLLTAQNMILDMRNNFDNLPVELRKKYGNPSDLIKAIETGDFEFSEKVKDKVKEIVDNEPQQ